MLRIPKLLMLILLLTLLPASMQAGAWVQKKGGYYLKISGNYLRTTQEFNHRGDKLNILEERLIFEDTSFRDINFNIYYEYGLTDYLTIVGNLPYKVLTTSQRELSNYFGSQNKTVTSSGFSDLNLSGRLALIQAPFAISFQGGVKIPLGYEAAPSNDGPRLGTAQMDIEGYLLIGRSLYPLPMYASAAIGYRKRGGRFNDEILFNAETGYTTGDFFFKLYFELLKSTVTPPDIYGQTIITPLPGGGGVLPDIIVGDQDISKISPSISYSINEGMAVQGEIIHILSGKNTISGTTFSLGLVFTR